MVGMTEALSGVRWEVPTDVGLARGLAAALRRSHDAIALELEVSGHTHRVTQYDLHAPPNAVVVPTTRHVEARLRIWTPARGISAADRRTLAAVLGVQLDARALLQRVATLSRRAYADNRRLERDLREQLGDDATMQSPPMRRCLERAHAVAPYPTPVLVRGPSGAGKELIARRIHALSPRASGPFVKINCGAIPESLAESELFGHLRGAFTGATTDRKGVFERAHGGTLLLDEVGELSPSTQVKLLRVLQEGTFTPVGGERDRHSDARVVAATHRDLDAAVSAGTFREDLFYRLAVFEVRVPALLERTEDLPLLIRHLLETTAQRMGRPTPKVPRDVMTRLLTHDWPGNVRELQNVLEGALVVSDGNTLVSPLFRQREPTPRTSEPVRALDVAIRAAIEAALRATGGKLYGPGGAAELLELNPGTLQSKMRKLGIDRRSFVRPTGGVGVPSAE